MENSNAEVGRRINETRKHRGYSREKLSEMAEVSVQFLADIEKGRKSMTIATLRRVAAALNVTTDYIVNGSEPFAENIQVNAMLVTCQRFAFLWKRSLRKTVPSFKMQELHKNQAHI